MENEKMIYRIIGQKESIIVTATSKNFVTFEEAQNDVPLVTGGGLIEKYVILPVATEEDWECGDVNFCPRCGYQSNCSSNTEFICNGCGALVYCEIKTEFDEE